jgi:uncharacterized protein
MVYKIFNTMHNHYLYDRQENRIVKINENEYSCFIETQKGNINENNVNIIKKFQKFGLCNENELCNIEHPYTDNLEFYLNERIEQITLQVTQNCNLRCDYCAYSGRYSNRKHSVKKMSLYTACKAVDFLVKHSRCTTRSVVGFYGGEPLLEIALIKNVISYIEDTYEGKEFNYVMTTNGTLLSDDIVDYLVEKKFSLMISLDGPENIHNKNRCFVNGIGSYQMIMKNLSRLKERYPEFYKKCSTNTVISPDLDYNCVENFLMKDDLLKNINTKVSFISDTGTNNPINYEENVFIEQRKDELKQLLIMLGEINDDCVNMLFGDYRQELHRKYAALTSGCLHTAKGHPGGPCIAGGRKTFIDTEGNIYPCEKIPETNEMMLGNIDTGFLIDKAKMMLNIAKITENQCKSCWAFIFCNSCVVSSIDEKGISVERRLKRCNGEKIAALETLKNIVRLQEYGYSFDYNF